jgi:hypothetical protein
MLPIIILLFILLFAAILLPKRIVGGAIDAKDIVPIKNKLFFIESENDKLINDVINKNNEPLQYFHDIPARVGRQDETNLIRTTIHVGQLKLFLSELEFLTECLPNYAEKKIVVYAGSAPSHKIYYLHTLFPNIKFIMVDPAEHFIMFEDGGHYVSEKANMVVYLDSKNKENNNQMKTQMINLYRDGDVVLVNKKENFKNLDITKNKKQILDWITNSDYTFYILEDYFSNDTAELFKDLDCYFISDIRSNINDMLPEINRINKTQLRKPSTFSNEENPSDLDISWNNAMHLNWLQRMQPKKAMLKFRLPWFIKEDIDDFNYYCKYEPFKSTFIEAKSRGIDFVLEYQNKKQTYFQYDDIYIQSFPGKGSSESRLICTRYDKFQDIDLKEYDEKFYYYNWFYRQFAFHNHDCMGFGIDGCNDCALMVKIFKDYFKKYNIYYNPDKIKYEIRRLLRIIRRTLNKELHGNFIIPYHNSQEIINRQSYYILASVYDQYEDELLKFK